MATSTHSDAQPLTARLGTLIALSEAERSAPVNLPMQVTAVRADRDIGRGGDRLSRCRLLPEGFACTDTLTREGKRQIMAFHLPGDIRDLQSLHLTPRATA